MTQKFKKFALTLHFRHRCYNDIKTKCFVLSLPRILRGWYQSVNCKPSITKEAIDNIKTVAEEKEDCIIALMFDEMSIRKHIEFDGPVGKSLHGDHVDKAKEPLVIIMAVTINYFWKIPIEYFLSGDTTTKNMAKILGANLSNTPIVFIFNIKGKNNI